jgi:ATP-dependent helicase/nuclease subunit A
MSETSTEQQIASDPNYSIWLSASAGTGKTKVLTDRVLRLLISGVEPRRILCLTFTNAAANEMKERIHSRISKWSVISDKELKLELEALSGSASHSAEVKKAKALLSNYLQKSESLNIYTIHSFCQKVLKQFPIEAQISPSFRIIDEINTQKIFALVKYSLITNSSLSPVVSKFLGEMHEIKLNELIEEILNHKIKFKYLFDRFRGAADYQNYLRSTLKLVDGENEISAILDGKKQIARYIDKMSISEIKKLLLEFVAASSDEMVEQFNKLKSFFLTADEQKKKKLLTKALQSEYPGQLEYLLTIQEAIFETLNRIKTYKLFESSLNLYELAKGVISNYESYKNLQNFLDYDDLIYYTHQLFTKSEFKDWILYKLDGGIEHILVDEAQDTNLNQWKLILAMLSDFVAGESSNKANKSIFVVGDEKQSIYSFQGAEYEQFNKIKAEILQQLANSQKKYQVVNLGTSYRSSKLILDTVNQIFNHIRGIDPGLFEADNFELKCHLENYGGRVEVWPLYKATKSEDVFWPTSYQEQTDDAQDKLAQDIASYIKDMIDSKKILFSTQRPVAPEDFMILLRQRNELAHKIVKELKKLQLPVAGLDRIALFEDLSVQDLLSAAKFALLPEDELNLACLLKSPIINLNDQDLYQLLYKREQNLYSQIQQDSKYLKVKEQLAEINKLARNLGLSDFFYVLVYGHNNLIHFLSRNGRESADPINELISLALKFEQEISGSLQEFVSWCSTCNIELARGTNNDNVIKIMTIHGAKGLQAPIVIVPETTELSKSTDRFLWDDNDCPFFGAKASQYCEFYDNLKQIEKNKQYKEYLRLLYVAATRAQEQLIFCGYSAYENINPNCWYNLVNAALEKTLKTIIRKDVMVLINESSLKSPSIAHAKQQAIKPLPLINMTIKTSYKCEDQQENIMPYSPLALDQSATYGEIIHKILEESLATKNIENLLDHHLFDLLPEYYLKLVKPKLYKLINSDEFKRLIQGEIMIEVSIGSQHEYRLSRIDLLSLHQDQATIIDYKTDKNVPEDINGVPEKYVAQLKSYKEAIQSIYPNKTIEAKILWIMAPSFMQIF